MNSLELLAALPREQPDICASLFLTRQFCLGWGMAEPFAGEWGLPDTDLSLSVSDVLGELESALTNRVVVKAGHGVFGKILGLLDSLVELGVMQDAEVDAQAAKIFWRLLDSVTLSEVRLRAEHRREERSAREAARPPRPEYIADSMGESEYVENFWKRPRMYCLSAIGVWALVKGFAYYKGKWQGENPWSIYVESLYAEAPPRDRREYLIPATPFERARHIVTWDPVVALVAQGEDARGMEWLQEKWYRVEPA